ncbi:hypothetical protein MMC25_007754 [Agyrium rufum]|nr:hypothetical protein [Agyrium rufum]
MCQNHTITVKLCSLHGSFAPDQAHRETWRCHEDRLRGYYGRIVDSFDRDAHAFTAAHSLKHEYFQHERVVPCGRCSSSRVVELEERRRDQEKVYSRERKGFEEREVERERVEFRRWDRERMGRVWGERERREREKVRQEREREENGKGEAMGRKDQIQIGGEEPREMEEWWKDPGSSCAAAGPSREAKPVDSTTTLTEGEVSNPAIEWWNIPRSRPSSWIVPESSKEEEIYQHRSLLKEKGPAERAPTPPQPITNEWWKGWEPGGSSSSSSSARIT